MHDFLNIKGPYYKGLYHGTSMPTAAPPQYTRFFFIPRVLRLVYCGSYEFEGRLPQYTYIAAAIHEQQYTSLP